MSDSRPTTGVPRPATGSGPVRPDADRSAGTGGRRRPPTWVLVLVGVLVVGAVAAAVLLLVNRPQPTPQEVVVPEAEVVTLPPATPTIEPVVREAGTAFFDALPSTVLSYALVEAGPYPPLRSSGAVEAYRLVYSDGGATTFTVLAGQWRDGAAPEALLGAALADPAVAAAAEQGDVEVDGEVVGRYAVVQRPDGTGTAWWTNRGVLIQVDGPADVLRDVYAGFPL